MHRLLIKCFTGIDKKSNYCCHIGRFLLKRRAVSLQQHSLWNVDEYINTWHGSSIRKTRSAFCTVLPPQFNIPAYNNIVRVAWLKSQQRTYNLVLTEWQLNFSWPHHREPSKLSVLRDIICRNVLFSAVWPRRHCLRDQNWPVVESVALVNPIYIPRCSQQAIFGHRS